MPVTIAASATITINGQRLVINSGDIQSGAGVKFSLSQPVIFGSAEDFATWVDTTFGTKIHPLSQYSKSIPDFLRDDYTDFTTGVVSIDALTIDTSSGYFLISANYRLITPAPVPFLSFIQFDGVGVQFLSAPAPVSTLSGALGTLDPAASTQSVQITVANGTGTLFNPTITVNGQQQKVQDTIGIDSELMLVTDVAGDTLTVTRNQNNPKLNPAPAHNDGANIYITNRPTQTQPAPAPVQK